MRQIAAACGASLLAAPRAVVAIRGRGRALLEPEQHADQAGEAEHKRGDYAEQCTESSENGAHCVAPNTGSKFCGER